MQLKMTEDEICKNLISSEKARQRWKLLSETLSKKRKRKKYQSYFQNSSKNLQTFDLLQFDNEIYDEINGTFSCCVSFREFESKINISLLTNSTDLQDLIGFDNTGNVRIWPSEEVMSYYCMKNRNFFENKQICELGAGMTGLASFFLASTGLPTRLLVTDGNEKSAKNLKFIKEANLFDHHAQIETRRLLWETTDVKTHELKNRFDVILAADCFFFKSADEILLKVIDDLLKPKGIAIFFAPLRKGTFRRFVDVVKRSTSFEIVQISEDYCHEITNIKEHFLLDSNFDFNYVYPFLLQIEKVAFENNISAADIIVEDSHKNLKFPRLS